jgi:hypothetical protein
MEEKKDQKQQKTEKKNEASRRGKTMAYETPSKVLVGYGGGG